MFDVVTEDLAGAIAALRTEDRSGWSGPARVARAEELGRAVERLTAEWTRAVADADRDHAWDATGAASAVNWLAHSTGCARVEASKRVAAARVAGQHDAVGDALRSGAVTTAHVDQLARASRHKAGNFAEHVHTLVEVARTLPADAFRRVVQRWWQYADDLLRPMPGDHRSWLDYAPSFEGRLVGRFELDPRDAAMFRSGIDAGSAPTDAADPRSASERRADALIAALTNDAPVRVNLDVLVDVDTVVGRERPIEQVRCELRSAGEINRVLMERLACDAHVGRVLTRGTSEVLDLGRRVRLATPAQRRAVMIRDEHCVWPGCDRPMSMCEVHHTVPFAQGGATNLDELALVCTRHHDRLHGGWKLARGPDGRWEAVPP
ncbi:MAG: DUF222 domain-containing protein [Acidimicrobiia bacterium]